MTESGGLNDTICVSSAGVSVEKCFDGEGFAVPAIRFELTSEREVPVLVTIVDRIPDGFPMKGVGFHEDYDHDRWTAYEDNRVEYERVLEPGERIVTVYGIRIGSPDQARPFLVEPQIERVERPNAAADDAGPSGEELALQLIDELLEYEPNEVVGDLLDGERSDVPGLDEDVDRPKIELDLPSPEETAADGGQEPDLDAGEADIGLGEDEAKDLLADLADDPEVDVGENVDGSIDEENEANQENDEEDEGPPAVKSTGALSDGIELGGSKTVEASPEDVEVIDDPLDFTGGGDDSDEEDSESAADSDEEPNERVMSESEQETEPTTANAESTNSATESADDDDAPGSSNIDLDLARAESEESPDEADDDSVVETETTEVSTPSKSEEVDTTVSEIDEPRTPEDEVDETEASEPNDASESVAPDTGSIASALADELRAGTVDDDDIDVLQEALGIDDAGLVQGSLEARLNYLQSQVDEVNAYTDALEEFLDENGTGSDLIEELNDEVQSVKDDLEAIEETVGDHGDRSESPAGSVADLEAEVKAFRDELESMENDIESLLQWRDQLGQMFG